MSIHAIYIKAPNDTYGNPRRGFLFLEDSEPAWFEPEGYGGVQGIARHRGEYLRFAMDAAPVVNVTATEYRRIYKEHA